MSQSIKMATMPSFPANTNPFNNDAYHMGTTLGNNVMVMHANHKDEKCKYLIIINVVTGERVKVVFDDASVQEGDVVAAMINKAHGL